MSVHGFLRVPLEDVALVGQYHSVGVGIGRGGRPHGLGVVALFELDAVDGVGPASPGIVRDLVDAQVRVVGRMRGM